MVANRYQQAAERLRRASRLGQRRVATPRQPDTILAPPPNRPADPPVPSENAVPHDAARQGPYHPYQHPSQYRPSPVKLGFGLGPWFCRGWRCLPVDCVSDRGGLALYVVANRLGHHWVLVPLPGPIWCGLLRCGEGRVSLLMYVGRVHMRQANHEPPLVGEITPDKAAVIGNTPVEKNFWLRQYKNPRFPFYNYKKKKLHNVVRPRKRTRLRTRYKGCPAMWPRRFCRRSVA
jgi:hypothetical protein